MGSLRTLTVLWAAVGMAAWFSWGVAQARQGALLYEWVLFTLAMAVPLALLLILPARAVASLGRVLRAAHHLLPFLGFLVLPLGMVAVVGYVLVQEAGLVAALLLAAILGLGLAYLTLWRGR